MILQPETSGLPLQQKGRETFPRDFYKITLPKVNRKNKQDYRNCECNGPWQINNNELNWWNRYYVMHNIDLCYFIQSSQPVRSVLLYCIYEKVKWSRVRLFVTTWTVAHQPPPSMGIFQARILEWGAIAFSMRSSWPRDWTHVSHIVGRCFTIWTTRVVHIWENWPTNHVSVHENNKIHGSNSWCTLDGLIWVNKRSTGGF